MTQSDTRSLIQPYARIVGTAVPQRLAGTLKDLSGRKLAGQDADDPAHYATLFPAALLHSEQ